MSNETELQKLIKRVDQSFEHMLILRIWIAKTRITFAVFSALAITLGYYYSQVTLNAAIANLLELFVALQSLSLSLLAFVVSMGAVFNNDEEDSRKSEISMIDIQEDEGRQRSAGSQRIDQNEEDYSEVHFARKGVSCYPGSLH